ncbi:YheT family hydrolase [Roseivirga sp. BDSF3-8]|uniref:YheT family hydrolase n=1 Tax=Roseivirga sp. BDSF3-8 TaxID=3241598 RepID=UPI003531A530
MKHPQENFPSYTPPAYLFNKHVQTIVPALFRRVKEIKYERERIDTPDGDFLDLDWSYTANSRQKLVIVSHGLEGDANRPYVKGMVRAFNQAGYDALAWNYRGCSGEMNRLPRFYHSGATEDLQVVLEHAIHKKRYTEVVLNGFSLGGNLTLKYLGELPLASRGDGFASAIRKAIVFSVPLDLHDCLKELSRPGNFVYSRRFLRNLKEKVRRKAVLMPEEVDASPLKDIKDLKTFDNLYTSILHGFRDAVDYYEQCSSISFLDHITVDTLIINAANDPFLGPSCYPLHELKNHPTISLEVPEQGGHCGFADSHHTGLYWSERRALQFLDQ